MKKIFSIIFVLIGAVALTSLGIDATQYLSGSPSALGILADRATEGNCPTGMVFVEHGTEDFCIDRFEVSVGESCPHQIPNHHDQTAANIQTSGCHPVSEEGAAPWTHVTYHQARELCAKAKKRLPDNTEWYQAALGTTESDCNTSGETVETNAVNNCESGVGAHNMIGNAWELVDAMLVDGVYGARTIPETGYVENADIDGVALATSDSSQTAFHNDYFWSARSGTQVMMRGGFYGSGDDAGLYSIHADVKPNFSSAAIGFRCIVDV